jgi:hypothetical protein
MKILVILLVLSTTAAPSAIARDSEEGGPRLRCSQIIILNPAPSDDMGKCCTFGDPWIAANHMSNCCFGDTYLGDCSDKPR